MDWTLLSWAFVAGAAATVNPCGIAMLPAYISYYLGREDEQAGIGRGLQAGLLLSLGTFAVFTVMGLVIAAVGTAIARFIPWLALLVAVALLVLGVMTLVGRAPALRLRGVGGAPRDGAPSSFVNFGVGYGLASLGCTLPIFMTVVSSVFSAAFLDGLMAFVAYGVGMGAVLTGISIAVALGKTAVLRWLRAAAPALKYVGGLGLLIAGSYVLAYNLSGLEFIIRGRGTSMPTWVGVGAFLVGLLTTAVLLAWSRTRAGRASSA